MKTAQDLLVDIGAKVELQNAQINILFGFVVNKLGRDDFFKHLEHVATSSQFSENEKLCAKIWIDQNNLWPPELLEGKKQ